MSEKKTNSTTKKADKDNVRVEEHTEAAKPIVAKDIDVHQFITVRNGFQGKLVYVSKRTGETFEWNEFGAEQDMELQELRNAKSSAKKFFQSNWFMFSDDDRWVIDYLGVGQFYRFALDIEHFDDIFRKSPNEIEKEVARLSVGQKRSVSYRAKQLIRDGAIDSNKAIAALERALGVELVEK